MMTRTARGYTDRPLQVSRAETLAYVLIAATAVMRVVPALTSPGQYRWTLIVAGARCGAAFLIYLRVFSRWLLSVRADGKDG